MTARPDGLGKWIAGRLSAHRNRPALATRTRYRLLPVTYGRLADRVARLRGVLRERGLSPGDRVILLGANSVDWAAAWLACIESGLVTVPLDSQTSDGLLRAVAAETKPALMLSDRPLAESGRCLLFDELARLAEARPAEATPPVAAADGDLLQIVYTSGTTGTPKGVMLTHGNLLANLYGLLRGVRLPFPMRFVSTLPLSHMLEETLGLLFPLSQGCTVIYPYTTRPSRLVRIIRDDGVHAMITVPGLLEALKGVLERAPGGPRQALGFRFRLVGVGGAALPAELEDWWRALRVQVAQGYGLTETGPLIALNTPLRTKRGSAGRPLPGAAVRIASDGEILVKGPNASPGYYRRPEETEKLYRDGWLRTGDIGELRGGWLFFRGRAKDVIVTSSGSNVYPDDVESALDAQPGVEASCVLQRRDKVWAALRLRPDADARRAVEAANARLMPHQRVGGWTVWPEADFPRTSLGKVRKFEVARRLDELEKRPAPPARPRGRLEELVGRVLGARRLAPDAPLSELGLDSLGRVSLLSALEQEFGVELEETAVTDRTTLADLAQLLEGQAQAPAARAPRWQFSAPAAMLRPALRLVPERLALALARPSCSGLENLRDLAAPAIFAVSHQSAWDAAVVRHFLPARFRRLAAPALPDFFGWNEGRPGWQRAAYRAMGLFIELAYGGYPFGPAVGTERSLEQTGRLLDRGYSIMIFPEGGRTPDGRLHPFMSGIGVLRREMSVPIVPVRVLGMREMLPYPRYIVPRALGRARVVFGEPLPPAPGEAPAAAAREVERAVAALGGE